MVDEVALKLAAVREALASNRLAGARLTGTDWFAWATCGGSSVIDTSAETGVAEVLITADRAVILADRIDGERLGDEERPPGYEMVETAWGDPRAREGAVRDVVDGGPIASDRPKPGEQGLPAPVLAARLRLTSPEIERYRSVSRDAARAVSESLRAARPDMTEAELATIASTQLLERGLAPVVVLVAGERRLPRYRHPTPRSDERLGSRAMLVVCARRYGLIANLTRFMYFRAPTADEQQLTDAVARVEARALDATRPGARTGDVFRAIVAAYADEGHAGAERDHHQGGLCGYRTRDEVATAASTTTIDMGAALAWNPSLPGAKIEDTVIVGERGLEILTVDPDWPTTEVAGRRRPAPLIVG